MTLATYRNELITLFADGWDALANSVPVQYPDQEFNSTGVAEYIRVNINYSDETQTSIGASTDNFHEQDGTIVFNVYVKQQSGATTRAFALASDIKDIFRNAETSSVRFFGPQSIDGPIDVSPFRVVNVTINFVAYLRG